MTRTLVLQPFFHLNFSWSLCAWECQGCKIILDLENKTQTLILTIYWYHAVHSSIPHSLPWYLKAYLIVPGGQFIKQNVIILSTCMNNGSEYESWPKWVVLLSCTFCVYLQLRYFSSEFAGVRTQVWWWFWSRALNFSQNIKYVSWSWTAHLQELKILLWKDLWGTKPLIVPFPLMSLRGGWNNHVITVFFFYWKGSLLRIMFYIGKGQWRGRRKYLPLAPPLSLPSLFLSSSPPLHHTCTGGKKPRMSDLVNLVLDQKKDISCTIFFLNSGQGWVWHHPSVMSNSTHLPTLADRDTMSLW